jgi:hypothetical protein
LRLRDDAVLHGALHGGLEQALVSDVLVQRTLSSHLVGLRLRQATVGDGLRQPSLAGCFFGRLQLFERDAEGISQVFGVVLTSRVSTSGCKSRIHR